MCKIKCATKRNDVRLKSIESDFEPYTFLLLSFKLIYLLLKAEEYTVVFFCVCRFLLSLHFVRATAYPLIFMQLFCVLARTFCLHTGCCCCFWWCVPILLNERRAHAHTLTARTILVYYFTISSWPYNALRMQLMVIFFHHLRLRLLHLSPLILLPRHA